MTKSVSCEINSEEIALYTDLLSNKPLRFNYVVFKGEQKMFESDDYNVAKDYYDVLVKGGE